MLLIATDVLSNKGWKLAFFSAIVLMIAPLLLFILEIQIANSALDVYLSDLGKHQEWKECLGSKKLRRKSTAKPDVNKPDAKKPA